MLIRIVAEIGVNWDGDLEVVKDMMQSSKDVGCNYVKFQAFNEDVIKEHPEKERLMKATITSKNIEEINSISKLVGIEWFCTPMYEEAVDFLDPFVNRYKIRVADGRSLITNKPSKLVNRVLDTRKEVIVSAESNPTQSIQYDNSDIKWLYCVSKYPCTFEDLDFENMSDFYGYSNHCPDILAPITAAILGAELIEIHITSDKTKKFIDNNVSFDYLELEKLVESIRKIERMKI